MRTRKRIIVHSLLRLGGAMLAVVVSSCATMPPSPEESVTTTATLPAEASDEPMPPMPDSEAEKSAAELAAEAQALVKQNSSAADLSKAFTLSGEAANKAPGDSPIALQHARHALQLAQTTGDLDRRAEIARQAIPSLNAAGISNDNLSPVSAYYRGSLTGMIMQAQGLGAAGKIPELEALFKRSLGAPDTHQGGPLRAIGMLYLKAPAWPAGIGDLELALENLEAATASYGNYPHNHICLAQALIEDGNQEEAREALNRAETILNTGGWGALGSAMKREIAEVRADLQ